MKKTWKIIFGGSGILGLLGFIVVCIRYWEAILPVLTTIGLFFQLIFTFLIQPYFLGVYSVIIILVIHYQIKSLLKRNRKRVIGIKYDYEGVTYIVKVVTPNDMNFISKRCSKCGVDLINNEDYCVKCEKDFSKLENGKERLNKGAVSAIMKAEYRKYLRGDDHELKFIYNK